MSVPYRGPPQEEVRDEVFFMGCRTRSLMVEGPGTHWKFHLDICLTCRAQTRTQEFGKPARGHALQDLLYRNKEELVRDVKIDGSLIYVIAEFNILRHRGKDWTESWTTCPSWPCFSRRS